MAHRSIHTNRPARARREADFWLYDLGPVVAVNSVTIIDIWFSSAPFREHIIPSALGCFNYKLVALTGCLICCALFMSNFDM